MLFLQKSRRFCFWVLVNRVAVTRFPNTRLSDSWIVRRVVNLLTETPASAPIEHSALSLTLFWTSEFFKFQKAYANTGYTSKFYHVPKTFWTFRTAWRCRSRWLTWCKFSRLCDRINWELSGRNSIQMKGRDYAPLRLWHHGSFGLSYRTEKNFCFEDSSDSKVMIHLKNIFSLKIRRCVWF